MKWKTLYSQVVLRDEQIVSHSMADKNNELLNEIEELKKQLKDYSESSGKKIHITHYEYLRDEFNKYRNNIEKEIKKPKNKLETSVHNAYQ